MLSAPLGASLSEQREGIRTKGSRRWESGFSNSQFHFEQIGQNCVPEF